MPTMSLIVYAGPDNLAVSVVMSWSSFWTVFCCLGTAFEHVQLVTNVFDVFGTRRCFMNWLEALSFLLFGLLLHITIACRLRWVCFRVSKFWLLRPFAWSNSRTERSGMSLGSRWFRCQRSFPGYQKSVVARSRTFVTCDEAFLLALLACQSFTRIVQGLVYLLRNRYTDSVHSCLIPSEQLCDSEAQVSLACWGTSMCLNICSTNSYPSRLLGGVWLLHGVCSSLQSCW